MKIQTIRDLIDQYGYRTLRLVAEVPQQASTLRITNNDVQKCIEAGSYLKKIAKEQQAFEDSLDRD